VRSLCHPRLPRRAEGCSLSDDCGGATGHSRREACSLTLTPCPAPPTLWLAPNLTCWWPRCAGGSIALGRLLWRSYRRQLAKLCVCVFAPIKYLGRLRLDARLQQHEQPCARAAPWCLPWRLRRVHHWRRAGRTRSGGCSCACVCVTRRKRCAATYLSRGRRPYPTADGACGALRRR
jgi:hypothetical protein